MCNASLQRTGGDLQGAPSIDSVTRAVKNMATRHESGTYDYGQEKTGERMPESAERRQKKGDFELRPSRTELGAVGVGASVSPVVVMEGIENRSVQGSGIGIDGDSVEAAHMERRPGLVCLREKFSSANFSP